VAEVCLGGDGLPDGAQGIGKAGVRPGLFAYIPGVTCPGERLRMRNLPLHGFGQNC
jgi:hypothetical protein